MKPTLMRRIYSFVGRRFRSARMKHFQRTFPKCVSVVDLGGTCDNWNLIDYQTAITCVNTDSRANFGSLQAVIADACETKLPSRGFDLAFSNSVIEHLHTAERQEKFAAEMERLAPNIWCQTPNKWFVVEPHLICLFVHWIPARWRPYWLIRYFTLWGLLTRPTKAQVDAFHQEVRLLTKRDMHLLFPTCDILVERAFGIPKSFIAVKRC